MEVLGAPSVGVVALEAPVIVVGGRELGGPKLSRIEIPRQPVGEVGVVVEGEEQREMFKRSRGMQ